MRIKTIIARFFIPSHLVTVYYYLKFRAMISFRAEVELSGKLTLGRKTSVGSFTKIKATDGPLIIGSHVAIANCCSIFADGKGVVIGDDCLISPNVSIVSVNYQYKDLQIPLRLQGGVSRGITIGKNVWIGSGSMILDGAQIGNNVIIAANSVVSSKLPDNVIAKGDPAKTIFTRR